MSKKNRPTDSGGNWMDTYGDMVTLLLTFFIMLYSMSNLDAEMDYFCEKHPKHTEPGIREYYH